MNRKLILGFLLLVSLPGQTSFLGGLTELANYQSALPCQSLNTCWANKGIMGYAIDRASDAGLDAESISVENKDTEIFVISKRYGRCLIDTNEAQGKGEFTFHCLLENKSKKTFSLKNENGKLALIEKLSNKKKGILK